MDQIASAKALNVIDTINDAFDIANAIAISVLETTRINLVNNRTFIPLLLSHVFLHRDIQCL